MPAETSDQLRQQRCVPCEGGVARIERPAAIEQLDQLQNWALSDDATRIRKSWVVTNFMEAIRFFTEIAELAENEGHHPDLHLEGYRNASVELWTHAIGGLSQNDFILAAKIDKLPVKLKEG